MYDDQDEIEFEDVELQSDTKKERKIKPVRMKVKLDENGEVRKKRKYVRRNLGLKQIKKNEKTVI